MRVFNYKKDIGNIVVTPEIRCRFMIEPPDKEREFHYHEGAGEVFLVLEGRVEFTIERRDADRQCWRIRIRSAVLQTHITRSRWRASIYLPVCGSPQGADTYILRL